MKTYEIVLEFLLTCAGLYVIYMIVSSVIEIQKYLKKPLINTMIEKNMESERMFDVIVDAIISYSTENGAVSVWSEWKDTMFAQGRVVNTEYIDWPIPQRDQELDAEIAKAVIQDFLNWIYSHKNLELVERKNTKLVDGEHYGEYNE